MTDTKKPATKKKRISLSEIVLKQGWHDSPKDGLCFNEAVALFAGEKHTDRPRCMDPVLARFVSALNDALTSANRQRLKKYIPDSVGTNDGQTRKRAEIVMECIRTLNTPAAQRAKELYAAAAVEQDLLQAIDLAAEALGESVKAKGTSALEQALKCLERVISPSSAGVNSVLNH